MRGHASEVMRVGGGLWQSRSRITLCLYGGITFAAVGTLGSYFVWLIMGCSVYMPFISDFAGGPIAFVFVPCMTVASILLTPSWIDRFLATKEVSFEGARFPLALWILQRALPLMGVWVCLCMLLLVWTPWQRSLQVHLYAAIGLFVGLLVLGVSNTLVRNTGRAEMWLTGFLLVVAGLSFLQLCILAGTGLEALATDNPQGDQTHGDVVRRSMWTMRYEFVEYCHGLPPSIHSEIQINVAAMFEWILLLITGVLALTQLQQDLQLVPSVGRPWNPFMSHNKAALA